MEKTNYFDHTNKDFQNVTVAVMNDILDSDISGSSMDDLYKTFSMYIKVTKEQFTELYNQASGKLTQWKDDGVFEGELSEEELDMVVGGSAGSFFSSIGDGIVRAAKATGNYCKEHALELALVAGAVILGACTGAIFGTMAAVVLLSYSASATAFVAGGAAIGAIGMGVATAHAKDLI